MPLSSWIIACMSAYICARFAKSVSPRAATTQLVELLVLPAALVLRRVGLEELREHHVGATVAG